MSQVYNVKKLLLIVTVVLFINDNYAQRNITSSNIPNFQSSILNPQSSKGNGMMFTQNKGQIVDMKGNLCPDVLFKGDGGGADVYLRKTGISYVISNGEEVHNEVEEQVEELEKTGTIQPEKVQEKKKELFVRQVQKLHRIDIDFKGSNTNPEVQTMGKLDGYTNYYYAQCPQGITNVNSYNEVTIKNVYNNIDVRYYGSTSLTTDSRKANGLKYDIVVNPGADPGDIKLKYTGAEELKIENGKLIIKTSVGDLSEYIPKVYQNIAGKIVIIKAEYRLTQILSKEDQTGTEVSFKLEPWNPQHSLIIDPIIWATYYGGSGGGVNGFGYDGSTDIATDAAGNVVVTGNTTSANFPTSPGAFQTVYGGFVSGKGDAFAIKFDSNGIRLWGTYYGGSGDEIGSGITTDKSTSEVTITGTTTSANFPVTAGAYQTTPQGGFIVKFDPNGVRLWATFYAATCSEITTDAAGNILITGSASANLPVTAGVFQTLFSGASDAFIAKFNSGGNQLWASYFGGSDNDYGADVATDGIGNIFITGQTSSTNFPVSPGAFQSVFIAGLSPYDAFVAKFDPSGGRLWATYSGGNLGNAIDYGTGIVADGSGDAVITGQTNSTDFPTTPGAFQPAFGGNSYDFFVAKFNGSNGTLLWSTYMGGNQWEYIPSCAIDMYNNIYILGEFEDTNSGSFPMNTCGMQKTFGGGFPTPEDWFVTKFNPDGKRICSTYVGGSGEDDLDQGGGGIATYGNFVYVTGDNQGGGFPVTAGAFQTVNKGSYGNVVVAKFCGNSCGENNNVTVNFTNTPASLCNNAPVRFSPSVNSTITCDTNNYTYKWTFIGGTPSSSNQRNPSGILYSSAGSYSVKLVFTAACVKDSITKTITINNCTNCSLVYAQANPNININCSNTGSATVIPGGGTAAYTYSWSNGQTGQTATGLVTGTYTAIVTDNNGCTTSSTVNINQVPALTATQSSTNISCISPGTASVLVNSGSSPYTYNWSNGQQGSLIKNLVAGGYTVTVIDAVGCSITKTFNITGSSPAISSFTQSPAGTVCKGTTINFVNTGTTGGSVTYSWTMSGPVTTSATSANFSYNFLSVGTYSIVHIVTNAGCSATSMSTVTVINCTGPTVIATSNSVCPGSCATVISTGTGGTSPYTYSWSTGATTQNINPCPASTTTYTITIKDTGGNTSTTTVVVTVNPSVIVTAMTTNINCNGGVGSGSASAGSGSAPYSYTWSNGQTTSNSTGLTSGNYTVTITDSKGCTGASTAVIISPPPFVGQFAKGTTNCAACGCKEWIMVTATGGTSPYSYIWPDGYINRYKNQLCPGIYTVNIKDKNGCSVNVNLTAP